MATIRAKFKKGNELKYISHLDLMRLFQRAIRRAKIPVEYTQGFNPHPKLSFATALSLGIPSDGEYIDIDLTDEIHVDQFINSINNVLPEGIRILKAAYVENSKSIMALIRWSTYIIEIYLEEQIDKEQIEVKLDNILSKSEILIMKEKKKKNRIIKNEVDIREYIRNIDILICDGQRVVLKTTLKTGSSGNLKPEVIIDLFEEQGIQIIKDRTNIQRLELFIEEGDSLIIPL